MSYHKEIDAYLAQECQTIHALNTSAINEVICALKNAYQKRATVYVFGNGGSAATASHMACDFNKGVCENLTDRFQVICLNDNLPTLLAIANDICYEDIFRYQLRDKLTGRELIIAISGSGNSENVVRAAAYAKEQGCSILALTGYDGGRLKNLADYSVHIPVDDMQITEDLHMVFNHMAMRILRRALESEASIQDRG